MPAAGPAAPPSSAAIAVAPGGSHIYASLAGDIVVLSQTGGHSLRPVGRIEAPCRGLLDLEFFRGELFALCTGGAVHRRDGARWREVLPAPASNPPVALQVTNNHLFRVGSGHHGMEPVDPVARESGESFVAVPLRGAGNPSGGVGVGGMGEVAERRRDETPPHWGAAGPAHTSWITARVGDHLELVLVAYGSSAHCVLRGAEVTDVAIAAGDAATVLVGSLRLGRRGRPALLVFDVDRTRWQLHRRWRAFSLPSSRPTPLRLRCR